MFASKVCLLIFVGLVAVKCNGEAYKAAPTCAKHECASYTVIHSQNDFEIRSYEDAQWLSGPTISSKYYKEATVKGFLILLAYYKGENREHVKINMTGPVLIDVQDSTYTVNFYVPKKYQNKIPTPMSCDIKPVRLPKHKYVAVRRFDGFITDKNITEHAALLKRSLVSTPYKRAAASEFLTLAGYNSPRQLTNRTNEVLLWFD